MILAFQIILGVGVAGFLVMVFRKVPVLLNYPRHPFEDVSLKQKIQNKIKTLKEKTGQSDFLHQTVLPNAEKFLRRFKIFILKIDNFLAKIVGHLRKTKQDKEESEEGDNDSSNLPT
jgi:hypothetical protein